MRKLSASLIVLTACLGSAAAVGNPGGGGSAPSVSAPRFDAAAEYRKGIDALKANRFAEAKKSFGRVLGVAPKDANANYLVGSSRVDLQACKLEYSIVSPK